MVPHPRLGPGSRLVDCCDGRISRLTLLKLVLPSLLVCQVEIRAHVKMCWLCELMARKMGLLIGDASCRAMVLELQETYDWKEVWYPGSFAAFPSR